MACRPLCCGSLLLVHDAAENQVAIRAAGGIPPLIALLRSPVTGVQNAAARALWNLSINGALRSTGAAARRFYILIEVPGLTCVTSIFCICIYLMGARSREQDCNRRCGGHSAIDCAAPLTRRRGARSNGGGTAEPEPKRCDAAFFDTARAGRSRVLLHDHHRARAQPRTKLQSPRRGSLCPQPSRKSRGGPAVVRGGGRRSEH